MAAPVFRDGSVRFGNLLRLSSRLRPTFLSWRHLTSQKISSTKRSTKGWLAYVILDQSDTLMTHPPVSGKHGHAKDRRQRGHR